MADDATRSELNRLYWESDESVSAIADHLDLSRRALYDGIEPQPSGSPCPECGAELVFRNRSAAEAREAECPDCGRAVEGVATEDGDPSVEQERSASALSPLRRTPVGDAPVLGLALLIGLALGAVAGYVLRRG